MRRPGFWGLFFGLALSAACGEAPAQRPSDQQPTPWPIDGFLAHAPKNARVMARLPRPAMLSERPTEMAALFAALGWKGDPATVLYGVANADGIDAKRAPGWAVTAKGTRIRYFPVADQAKLNASLQPLRSAFELREKSRWTILETAATGDVAPQDTALPPGDFAVRLHSHPLLTLLARPGDILDIGVTLHKSGLEFEGVVRAGATATQDDTWGRAEAGYGGVLVRLPGWLAVRAETTAPPTALAATIARRFAFHAGIKDGNDRLIIERLIREALSGAAQSEGVAFGIEIRGGQATCVVTGSRVGDLSPTLEAMRNDDRSTFGPLVFDALNVAKDRNGWALWLVEPQPKLDGLPEAFWPMIAAATEGEDGPGLTIAYSEVDDQFAFAIGPRANALVTSMRKRMRNPGGERGADQLWYMQQRGAEFKAGAYVAGVVISGQGIAELNATDRAALGHWFGAGKGAKPPQTIALAVFRDGLDLRLFGRVIY